VGVYIGKDGLMHNQFTDYPNMEEVEAAGRVQLGRWCRFLPSPGMDWVNDEDYKKKLATELNILQRVLDRFDDLGGWDTQLSKQIGWTL
jgi:hypothetical protein